MGFTYIQKIPSVDEILNDMPLSPDLIHAKQNRDQIIKDVITGKNDKFLLIIGPCSADNEDAIIDYVNRLRDIQEIVSDKLVLVPRVFTNKPRTTGSGYKGMAHQPDPGRRPNMVEGLKSIRKLHIRIIKETGLSAADEMLYPSNYPYLEDVLSYVAIGARSVENQQHRLTVSGLDVPIGMKNPTSGDIFVMLNAVYAAQTPHIFIYNGWEVETAGNDLAHCILRGSINHYGHNIPNYHYEDLLRIANLYEERALKNLTIIVDTNHSNSNKTYSEQPRIALEVMRSRKESPSLKHAIKGLMIESYLLDGSQEIPGKEYGKSITDACLGWEETHKLILSLANSL